jgi:hypothetical protein
MVPYSLFERFLSIYVPSVTQKCPKMLELEILYSFPAVKSGTFPYPFAENAPTPSVVPISLNWLSFLYTTLVRGRLHLQFECAANRLQKSNRSILQTRAQGAVGGLLPHCCTHSIPRGLELLFHASLSPNSFRAL